MRIFMVAWFKYAHAGAEYGFERIHLQTFYTKLKDAEESISNFDNEAGWYEGVLIEEKEEGNPFFRGKRIFYLQDKSTGELNIVPESEKLKCVINLIC